MKGHVRRRGPDTYEIAVYRGRIGDKRQYLYETVHGTRRKAEARCAELVAAVTHNRYVDRPDHTVSDLAEEWFDSVTDDRAPNTLRNYRSVVDNHVIPLLGDIKLAKLDVATLERAYRMLRRGEGPNHRALSTGTVRQIHAVISGMCSLAVRYGWLAEAPTRHVKLPPERLPEHFALPDHADVDAIATMVGQRDPDRATFVYLAVGTGARRGELCGIRWTDLDLDADAPTLTIARTVTRTLGLEDWLTKEPKGGRARRLALDADLVAELKRLHARSAQRALLCGVPLLRDGFLFTNAADGSRPWSPEYVTHWWARACKAHGVQIRFHDLRHLHASDMAEVAPIPVVKERLGHSQLKTTTRYAHVRADSDRAGADILAARRRAR